MSTHYNLRTRRRALSAPPTPSVHNDADDDVNGVATPNQNSGAQPETSPLTALLSEPDLYIPTHSEARAASADVSLPSRIPEEHRDVPQAALVSNDHDSVRSFKVEEESNPLPWITVSYSRSHSPLSSEQNKVDLYLEMQMAKDKAEAIHAAESALSHVQRNLIARRVNALKIYEPGERSD
ncbi:hypothetical protein BDZ89DRAFT_1136842 [Hymenopellis radicata]|nr:hypothetical protein BDZ89DRAFT_1136842 [Hymenopellis radicata]